MIRYLNSVVSRALTKVKNTVKAYRHKRMRERYACEVMSALIVAADNPEKALGIGPASTERYWEVSSQALIYTDALIKALNEK